MTSDKDARTYMLGSNQLSLQSGQRFTLNGKPGKKHSGARDFGVNKLVKDGGSCNGHADSLTPR
jgi:hypothetical protein